MHTKQRDRFLDVLARENACALIPSGAPPIRNNDCEYPFRPHSDFYYLTGFREPDSYLLLLPHDDEARSVLFLRERDREDEIWTGRRLGVERAPEALGVDAAYDVEDLWSVLPELLKGSERLVYRLGEHDERDRELIRVVGDLRARARRGEVAPTHWIDPSAWLHELRLFKSEDELARMRRAAELTAEAHLAAMRAAGDGVGEAEIDALLDYSFRRRGGSGPAYANIVAGGANACILHYTENDQPLRDGDLLLIDAGAEVDCYAADVTRTFPVSGTFGTEQRALYEVVLQAQKAAIEAAAPGVAFQALHEVAVRHLCEGLVNLGLLEGTAEQVRESKAYARFYMHSTGHWLGLDVHDCGTYWRDGASRPLEPGMVFTVEPGLYVAPDDPEVEERWRGIGVRIEDDVLVTEDGIEVLTAAIPKEVEEVEAVCQGRALLPT